MKSQKTEITFHNLLNKASSIRNVLYLLFMGKKQPEEKTKQYLEKTLKNANSLIEGLQKFREDLQQD